MVSFTALLSAVAAASFVAAAPAQMEKRGYSGQATYYFQNGNPGACGDYNPDSALIVAMNHEQYAQGNCGKWVKITNTANGKTVTAKIAVARSFDMCPGCDYGSIDLSRATFATLGSYSTGVLPISWDYTSQPE